MPIDYFVYGGTPSSRFDIFVKQGGIHRPLLPPTRERLITIPQRPGQWDFGPLADSLKIEIDCWMSEDGRLHLVNYLDAIASWLDPTAGPRPLMIYDQPGRYYNARYSGVTDIAFIVSYAEFKLPFICTDPFAHGI